MLRYFCMLVVLLGVVAPVTGHIRAEASGRVAERLGSQLTKEPHFKGFLVLGRTTKFGRIISEAALRQELLRNEALQEYVLGAAAVQRQADLRDLLTNTGTYSKTEIEEMMLSEEKRFLARLKDAPTMNADLSGFAQPLPGERQSSLIVSAEEDPVDFLRSYERARRVSGCRLSEVCFGEREASFSVECGSGAGLLVSTSGRLSVTATSRNGQSHSLTLLDLSIDR